MESVQNPQTPNTPQGWVTMKLHGSTSCSFCGNPLMVNGIQSELFCYQCKNANPVSNTLWNSLAKELAHILKTATKFGENYCSASDNNIDIQFTFERAPIKCQGCQAELPFVLPEDQENPNLTCASCNTETPLRVVPIELQSQTKALQWIAAEEHSFSSESKLPNQTHVQKCPSCGGSLSVDGKSRVVTCAFCESKVTLPDDVWHRLNPVLIRKPWYLVFKRSMYKTDRERLEDKAREKRNKAKHQRTTTPPIAQKKKETVGNVSFFIASDVWFRKQAGFLAMILHFVIIGRLVYLYTEARLPFMDFLMMDAKEDDLPVMVHMAIVLLLPVAMFLGAKSVQKKLSRGWKPEDDHDDRDD